MKILFSLLLIFASATAMRQSGSFVQLNPLQVRQFFESKIKEKLGQYSQMALTVREPWIKRYPECKLFRYVEAYVLKSVELYQKSKQLPL